MKIGVVGSGFVGSSAAYAMVLRGVAKEIVLVDVNEGLGRAQTEDILHATPFSSPVQVHYGGFEALKGTNLVVLACGVNQKPGESRLDLLKRNSEIFSQVVPQVLKATPHALLLVASNPVDIITTLVTKISGLPPQRVLGSGTILDTARFRSLLGEHFHISPQAIHAYVVGEHGDSEVLVWSSAIIGGSKLEDFAEQHNHTFDEEVKSKIDQGVRLAADRIIRGKKATYYGIGAGLARMALAIRDNERTVFTATALDGVTKKFGDVSFAMPRIIGEEGIVSTMEPDLSKKERKLLEKSIDTLKAAVSKLN